MKVNLIELGSGKFVVTPGYFGECAALFIEPAPVPGDVAASAYASGLQRDAVADGGTVITFDNLRSAGVLAEKLEEATKHIGERRGSAARPADVLADLQAQ